MKYSQHMAPISLFLCLAFWIAWSLLDRDPLNLRLVEISSGVPGGTATVTYHGTLKEICDGLVHRWIVDRNHNVHNLADGPVCRFDPLRREGQIQCSHQFEIPSDVPPGPAIYDSQTQRWCNFWQWAFWPIERRYTSPMIIDAPRSE